MESTLFTADTWKAIAERVLATTLQTLIAMLAVDGLDLIGTDWKGIASVVGSAALLSLLKSVLAVVATKTGPSMTDSEQVRPAIPQPEGH